MVRGDPQFDVQSLSYGPGREDDPGAWMLVLGTEEARIELTFDEEAMYDLWVDVQHVPWPREPTEKGVLVRRLVERARGADADSVRDALRAIGATGSDLTVDPDRIEAEEGGDPDE